MGYEKARCDGRKSQDGRINPKESGSKGKVKMLSNQLVRMGSLNEDRWRCQHGGKAQGHGEQGEKQHQKQPSVKVIAAYLERNCEKVLEAKYHVTQQVLGERHPSCM